MSAVRNVYATNKKAKLPKRWPRDAPCFFPEIFNGVLFHRSCECAYIFEIYRFKVGAFFETLRHIVVRLTSELCAVAWVANRRYCILARALLIETCRPC